MDLYGFSYDQSFYGGGGVGGNVGINAVRNNIRKDLYDLFDSEDNNQMINQELDYDECLEEGETLDSSKPITF